MLHLYVIGPKTGPVKIGISGSAIVRLDSLQTGHPHELDVLAEVGECCRKDEEDVHKYFAQHRLQGEWFKRTRRLERFIEMLNSGVSVQTALQRLAYNRRRADGTPIDPVVIDARKRFDYHMPGLPK